MKNIDDIAHAAGVSIRTAQRAARGHTPALSIGGGRVWDDDVAARIVLDALTLAKNEATAKPARAPRPWPSKRVGT
jgi:hypothetical protein